LSINANAIESAAGSNWVLPLAVYGSGNVGEDDGGGRLLAQGAAEELIIQG